MAVKGSWDVHELTCALRAAGVMSPEFDVHLACECAPRGSAEGIDVIVQENSSLFQLWGVAASRCRASAIAFLHGHAPPAPGWGQAMLAALGSNGALCGPVEPSFEPTDRRIIGYLVEYCQFHRPVSAALSEVPGNNLILDRSMLPPVDQLLRAGFSKTAMLSAGTLRPTWVNDALVRHQRPFALLPFCRRRFHHGRAYGAARLSQTGTARRIVLIAATPVLPLLRVIRIIRHGWRHSALRGAIIRRLPAMLLTELCWSAGELTGYITAHPGHVQLLD